MFRRVLILAAVVSLLAGFDTEAQRVTINTKNPPTPATPPPSPPPKTEMVKFLELKKFRAGKDERYTVKFTQLGSTKIGEFPVDIDPTSRNFDDLRDLQSGDYVTIEMTVKDGKIVVTSAEAYNFTPGEDEKDVYLFYDTDEKKVAGRVVPTLRVNKMGKRYEFLLPTVAAKREQLMSIIDDLHDDDAIVVLVTPGTSGGTPTIKDLSKYEPPGVGKFVKVIEIPQEKGKLGAMVIADERGAERTFTFPQAKDASFKANARKFKDGDVIQYRTTTDDKGTWLAEFKPAPKNAEFTRHEKPAPKTPAKDTKDSKNAKDDESDTKKDTKKDAKPEAKSDAKSDTKPDAGKDTKTDTKKTDDEKSSNRDDRWGDSDDLDL